MEASDDATRARRTARFRLLALGAVGVVSATACSGATDEVTAAPPVTEETPAPTTEAVLPDMEPDVTTTTSTSAPTTTTSPIVTASTAAVTTTTTTSTSTTTTTLVVEAPAAQPIAPPSDEYAEEPVIEVGSIAIPKLGVDMTMYEGIRLTTLDRGPGHWPGSGLPGEAGNVVVAGHRVSNHQVFRNVDQLVAGDEIVFRDGDEEHVYHVNRVEIVDPTAIWIVDPTETATATLFACHPPGSTAQRIVVFADLADASGS